MEEEPVLLSVEGNVATITLNRPRALNALNTAMVKRVRELLRQWTAGAAAAQPQSPPAVACVVVKGSGGRAFCAGGDVKWVVAACRSGDPSPGLEYFNTEYDMDLNVARFPLPYVSLLDGFVMGGGVGLAVHGHFRVATERTVFAMPECAIGLWPDVGASFFLNRLPGALGMYLGLTGARLHGRDVRAAGVATHFVPSHLLPGVERSLHELRRSASDLSAVNALLCRAEASAEADAGHLVLAGDGSAAALPFSRAQPWIDAHFGGAVSVAGIATSLRTRRQELAESSRTGLAKGGAEAGGGGDQDEVAWLDGTIALLSKGSPLSQVVTHSLLTRMRRATLVECLDTDRQLAASFLSGRTDFFEGVTAALVEKRAARWAHAGPSDVPRALVEAAIDGSLARGSPSRM